MLSIGSRIRPKRLSSISLYFRTHLAKIATHCRKENKDKEENKEEMMSNKQNLIMLHLKSDNHKDLNSKFYWIIKKTFMTGIMDKLSNNYSSMKSEAWYLQS